MLNLENYNQNRGIYSPLTEHNGIICGFWMVGNDYHNPSKYYGAYPPSYLKRMKLLFPDANHVLHLFSGKVQKGYWTNETTIDCNPDLNPDIVGMAEKLSECAFWQQPDLILADPPYNQNYLKYGTDPVHKVKVIKECSKILQTGGYLVWLDTIQPIWSKSDGWKLRGTIGFLQSTNHAVRVISMWEKVK